MRQILIEKYIKPSEIEHRTRHYVIKRWLDRNGDLHSFLGQPAVICYNNEGTIIKHWHKKGKRHREKGLPAYIWYKNEKIHQQRWYKNDKEYNYNNMLIEDFVKINSIYNNKPYSEKTFKKEVEDYKHFNTI